MNVIRFDELAQRLGTTRRTLRRYCAEGRVPVPLKVSRKCWIWQCEDIEDWLEGIANTAKENEDDYQPKCS